MPALQRAETTTGNIAVHSANPFAGARARRRLKFASDFQKEQAGNPRNSNAPSHYGAILDPPRVLVSFHLTSRYFARAL